jgi:hypothetical protein
MPGGARELAAKSPRLKPDSYRAEFRGLKAPAPSQEQEQTTARANNGKSKQRQEQTTARTNNGKNKQRQEQTTARTNNGKSKGQAKAGASACPKG